MIHINVVCDACPYAQGMDLDPGDRYEDLTAELRMIGWTVEDGQSSALTRTLCPKHREDGERQP